MVAIVVVGSIGLAATRGSFREILDLYEPLPALTRVFLFTPTFYVLPAASVLAFGAVCMNVPRSFTALVATCAALCVFLVVYIVAMYLPVFMGASGAAA